VITETAIFNPFPGLRSFEADEEHLFFGRERQIDELLARLRRTRFLAVVGTSGSGKSSLVRAASSPRSTAASWSRRGPPGGWRCCARATTDRQPGGGARPAGGPGERRGRRGCRRYRDRPAALRGDLEPQQRAAWSRPIARRGCRRRRTCSSSSTSSRSSSGSSERRIKDSREAATAFVQLLLTATQQGEAPIYVVFTMRSDFIGNCTEFPGLAEATNEGQYLVPRMSREERRAAICGPVAVGGGEISPRLVLRLLNDVGRPDQLPILQHALLRTWDYWAGHHAAGEPLDLRHYEAIGTLREALSLHAEEAYRELATPREQEVAEKLFKALTEKGADSRGVRRPVRLEEVAGLAGAEVAEVAAVVERFRAPGRSFLMPPAACRSPARPSSTSRTRA